MQQLCPEYKLLLCCARRHITQDISKQIKPLASSDINWDQLLAAATKHKVMPLLYVNLDQHAQGLVPNNIYNILKKDSILTAQSSLLLTVELIKITTLLQSNGIKAIPFKGPTLEALAYGDFAPRLYGDLDVYVTKEKFLQARKILLAHNYKPAYFDIEQIDFELLTKSSRHDALTKDGVHIELHWRIESVESRFKDQQALAELYLDTTNIDLNGFSVPSFNLENLIIFLILHCASHRWAYISLLCDVAFLCDSNPDINWDKIIAIANKLHIRKMVSTTFYLMNTLLEFEPPAEIQTLIDKTSGVKKFAAFVQRKFIFTDIAPGLMTKSFCTINSKDSLWKGIDDLIYDLFIPTDTEFAAITLPKKLQRFYFLARPLSHLKSIWQTVCKRK